MKRGKIMPVTLTDIQQIPISYSNLRWAAFTAIRKLPYTASGMLPRKRMKILDNIFQGDLAKSALINNLISAGVNITQEYDRVRTDNYRYANRLGYHFIANNSKIDVNSSRIPAGYTRHRIINSLDIKVTAQGSAKRPITLPLDLPFDIAVQMYFHTDRIIDDGISDTELNLFSTVTSVEDPLIDSILNRLYVQDRYMDNLYGYGWASNGDIEQFRINNSATGMPTTWSIQGYDREYWKCPIGLSNPFNTLHINV